MKKKLYHINLNQNDTENLKTWLEPQGVTFSAFMQMLIADTLRAVTKFIDEDKTPVLTASGLLEVAREMAKEEEKNAKKKTKK